MTSSPKSAPAPSRRLRAPRPATDATARVRPRPEEQARRAIRRSDAEIYAQEEAIDKTIEMSFPASDPPSWTP